MKLIKIAAIAASLFIAGCINTNTESDSEGDLPTLVPWWRS